MEKLKPDTSYHIFNHANGFENIFKEPENYRFFLEKYRKYISPMAETYAYCLMPNHFHLVIRIRKTTVIEELIRNKNNRYPSNKISNENISKVQNFGDVKITNDEIEKFLSKQFSNLFSSYTQAFNKVNNRMGSMFIKNFKRESIENKRHFLNAVIYTHRNPVHHGFRESMDEWPHSSYFDVVFNEDTFAESQKLLAVFGGIESFIQKHKDSLNLLSSNFYETP